LSDQQRGIVVEFVGLPGAGKSTVAPLLGSAIASRGWSWGSREMINGIELHRMIRYRRLIEFYLGHPPEIRAAVRLGSTAPSLTPFRLMQAIKYVSIWSYRLALARRRQYQFLVLDQGVVQDAWSLLLRGPWRDDVVQAAVSRTILGSGLTHLLVYFDIGVDLAAQRIAQRPTRESHFDLLDQGEAVRQLKRQSDRLEALFTRVTDATGVRHCRVDAAQPPAEVCSEIESFVEASVRRSGLHAVLGQ
jgi:thymidylate kinase